MNDSARKSYSEFDRTHTATLLPDGTVLAAGGNSKARPGLGVYSYSTGTAEIFRELP